MGYPKSRETLGGWVVELAPGQRKHRGGPNPKKGILPTGVKVQAVAELEARTGSAYLRRRLRRQALWLARFLAGFRHP